MNARAALAVFALAMLARGFAGELRCASAESMAGLMETWTRDFNSLHPETPARVTLRMKFAAAAFEAFVRGEVDVVPFARELFPAERAAYAKKFGGPPQLVPVATGSRATKGGTHAIAIFVNEKNPLTHISLEQLRKVFARDGGLSTWGQLGLTGQWAVKKISLHGMVVRRETGNPPGIVNFLEQRLLAGRAWRTDFAEHADVANGPQGLELIVRSVATDEGALGYSGFGYAQPGTKTLALAETDAGPFFPGTSENVASRAYPLARTIYLCIGRAPDDAPRAFVRFALSAAGQRAIAEDAQKFFPLPSEANLATSRAVAR